MRQMYFYLGCEHVNSVHQLAVLSKLSVSAGVNTVYRYLFCEESAGR